MTSDASTIVSARQRLPDPNVNAPVALSFTRFVAAHGGSDSLRAAERPSALEPVRRNPLTFTRHLWLVACAPGRAGANGESV